MRVAQLIQQLKDLDPDAVVLMSSDAEGNDFNPLYELSTDVACQKEGPGEYDFFYFSNTAQDLDMTEAEFREELEHWREQERAVILWPT